MSPRTVWRVLALALCAPLLAATVARAQTDEIQVYDGALAAPGVVNLTLHDNFTPEGAKIPAFPDAVLSNHSFNGVAEWAYGVTRWFEAGLYMPLYSVSSNHGETFNGFKLRALFAVPHADARRFFYGANFEFSVNNRDWDPRRFTSEVRPIVGWHLHPVDIIINPILDTSYDGFRNLDFAPSMRVAYNLNDAWALAAEDYSDFGPLHGFYAAGDQAHQLYAVVDHSSPLLDVEAGIGFGLTHGSDGMTLKLILSRDLNHGRHTR
ncbi:MAG: hypothetical protein KGN76_00580 [Acidobacteriota bacterium]|nr:hypothetical protein [Acidobacteriota bacterium]